MMPKTKFDRFFLFTIVFLTLGLSLVYIYEIHYWDVLNHIYKEYSPMRIYESWAKSISKGDFLSKDFKTPYYGWMSLVGTREEWSKFRNSKAFYYHPLYPYIVGIVFDCTENSLAIIYILQAMLNALIPIMIFYTAKKCSNEKSLVPYIASAIFPFYGTGIFYTGLLLPNTMTKLCLLALTYLVLVSRDKNPKFYIFPGLFTGVLLLFSPSVYFIAPFVLIGIIVEGWKTVKTIWVKCGIFLLGFILVMTLPVARNLYVGSSLFTLSSALPWQFAAGNMYGASGIGFDPPSDFIELVKVSENSFFPAFWLSLKSYSKDPFAIALLIFKKGSAFINNREYAEHENIYYLRFVSSVLSISCLSFGLLVPFGLLGFISKFKKKAIFLYLISLALVMNSLFLYYDSGTRDLFSPFMMIFGAFGISRLFDFYKNKSWKELVLIVLVIFGGFFMAFTKLPFPVDIKTPFGFYVGLARASESVDHDEKAERAYKKAIMMEPGNYMGYYFLGEFYYNRRQFQKSAVEFEKVVKINDNVKYAHGFLGISYLKIYLLHPKDGKIYLEKACKEFDTEISNYPDQEDILILRDNYCVE